MAIVIEPTDPATQAAKAIGEIVRAQVDKGINPPEGLIAELTRARQSERPALKDAAGGALRRIGKGASAAIPGLIRDLAESTSKAEPGPGEFAAQALGDIAPGTDRAAESIAALTSALDAKPSTARIEAVRALGRFGPAAVEALPKVRGLGEVPDAGPDLLAAVKLTADQLEGKAPPDSARRKGRGRRTPAPPN